MFTIGISFGFFMLGSVYGGLFYGLASKETASLVTLTAEIICFLLCVPLFFGYVAFCIRLVSGKDANLTELFEYYCTARLCGMAYSYFLRLLPAFVLKVAIPIMLIGFAFEGVDMIAPYFLPELLEVSAATRILQGVFFVPALIIAVLCFFLLGNDIIRLLCFCANKGDTRVLPGKTGFFTLRLSLIPLYALSVLSFGVLFLAYTFPVTLIVYSLFLGLDSEDTQKTAVFTAAPGNTPLQKASDKGAFVTEHQTYENGNNGDTAVFDINDFKENN